MSPHQHPHAKRTPVTAFLLTLLLTLGLLPSAYALDQAAQDFRLQAANSLLLRADTPEGYGLAAEAYAQLVRDGSINGPLLYNYGSALLAAGQHEAAARVLLRAERYSGTTPAIRKNLRLALAGNDARIAPPLPWHRPLLFWHYGLPASTRAMIAAAAFSTICIILMLRLLTRRTWGTSLIMTGVTLLLLFGASLATTLFQETRDRTAVASPPAADAPSAPSTPDANRSGGTP